MEKHTIKFGNKTIEFELERKNVKHINLRVKPDLRVLVSAEREVPLSYIESFVKKKSGWILKSTECFQKTQSENNHSKQYVNGETVRYLGKQYRLRVVQAETERVKYFQGFIYLFIKDKDHYAKKERLLNRWLREKAREIFTESLNRMHPRLGKYGIKKPNISIRIMKTRWGSCSSDKNKITLNSELIKAPRACIDYVILHELIHFKYRNHDKTFYNFLTALMPDWKERKKMLDSEIVLDL